MHPTLYMQDTEHCDDLTKTLAIGGGDRGPGSSIARTVICS